MTLASAGLAGALNRLAGGDFEWPPDPLSAGDSLVRLKKAYERLTDAIAGAEAAEEQRLAEGRWIASVRSRVEQIRESVRTLIDEVRDSLA